MTSRSRKIAPVLLAATTLLAVELAVAPSGASAAPRGWDGPKRIPGTVGLANPMLAVAPDGAELVTWHTSIGGLQNAVDAKLRLPGRTSWVTVPRSFSGTFLGLSEIVGTAGGDFWATYATYEGGYTSYIVRLDVDKKRWTRPRELFTDQPDHYHGTPALGVAADGTLVVAAYAPPKAPPGGDPVARAAVSVKAPGKPWKSRFLSPADDFANRIDLAVNPAGDILVSFIQGYNLGELAVRAATKSRAQASPWKVRTLSTAGDSQLERAAIGANGRAAVIWGAPDSAPNTAIRVSTANSRSRNLTWTRRNAVTGSNVDFDPRVVVGSTGQVTALWRQIDGGTYRLWSRQLVGNRWKDPVQLSPEGERSYFHAALQRPDGRTLVIYQRNSSTGDRLAIDYRTLRNGAAGRPVQLIGDEATDDESNTVWAGTDAASRIATVWYRGVPPDSDFVWMGNKLGKPLAMTSSTIGKQVKRARLVGKPKVGKRLTCATGYWVETKSVRYQWFNDGSRIRHAAGMRYKVKAADEGDRLTCAAVAKNVTGTKTLRSKARRIR